MRIVVDILEDQIRRLARICQRERPSRAEIVRLAITLYLRQKGTASEDRTFGLWRERGLEGLSCQDALRGDWPR